MPVVVVRQRSGGTTRIRHLLHRVVVIVVINRGQPRVVFGQVLSLETAVTIIGIDSVPRGAGAFRTSKRANLRHLVASVKSGNDGGIDTAVLPVEHLGLYSTTENIPV